MKECKCEWVEEMGIDEVGGEYVKDDVVCRLCGDHNYFPEYIVENGVVKLVDYCGE